MATANIKITALSDITSANMTYQDLVAVVDMNGTPETKKANIQLVGNLILNSAGGSYFPAAAQAVLAQSVTNAAQPNITSTGTLTSLAVTGNAVAGNMQTGAMTATYFVGDGANLTNLPAGIPAGDGGNLSNLAGANVTGEVAFAAVANSIAVANVSGIGNVALVNLDGNVSNILHGDGTWSADATDYSNANVTSLLAAFGSNTISTTGLITGDGGGLSNVPYANVTGTPTLGNVSTVNLDGNASNILHGDGTWSADATDYSNANVVSLLAAFGSNTITTTGLVTADLGGGSNIIGANVTGEVSFAATANAVAYANVSGTPTLGNISTIDLDGNASNVLRGDGTFGADANSSYGDSNVVSLLGSFGSNTVDTTGNISAGNLISGGEANVYSLFVDAGGANIQSNVEINGDISNVEYIFANANISTNNNFISLANVYAVDGIFTGNVSALNIGNISAINLDGNASNVLRGDGTFGADANSSYGDSNVVTLLGSFGSNTITTTGLVTADGGGISNVPYANVTGTPTLGNISTIDIDGSASNVLYGNGVFAAAASPALTGDGYQIANLTGANVSGEVSFAATANAVAGANVSGEVGFAAVANSVAGANVSGEVTNAATANAVAGANVSGEVSFAATANAVALANVSGAGNIASIDIDGAAGNVLYGNGVFAAAPGGGSYGDSNVVTLLNAFGSNTITTTGNVAFGNVDASSGDVAGQTGTFGLISGALISPSQANITEVGTLSNLVVSGNIQGNVNGFSIGYLEIPQVPLTADDTIALEDSGKHFHSNTAGNITLTIPTNATVAFPVGTEISIVEEAAGNILVNAAAGVNLYLAGNSTAANRVLGTYGMATIMKTGTDTWFINGTGVS